jgi:hypothetical protein
MKKKKKNNITSDTDAHLVTVYAQPVTIYTALRNSYSLASFIHPVHYNHTYTGQRKDTTAEMMYVPMKPTLMYGRQLSEGVESTSPRSEGGYIQNTNSQLHSRASIPSRVDWYAIADFGWTSRNQKSQEDKMDILQAYLQTVCPPLNTTETLIEDMRNMPCHNGLTAFTVAFARKTHLYLKLLQPEGAAPAPPGEEGEILQPVPLPENDDAALQLRIPE